MITLATTSSEFGDIAILRSRKDGSHVYCQGGCIQSQADRNGVSLAAYVHAIYDLVLQADARNVLVIGGAGGTLGTMLVKAGRSVTMVDINPQAFVFARRYFLLDPKVVWRVGDGRAFLARLNREYDAIIVDAFCGEEIAAALGTVQFFRLARLRLTRSGVILINVFLAHDLDPLGDVFAAGMMEAGIPAMLLDTPGAIDRNAIVLGGFDRKPHQPKIRVTTDALREELVGELERMRFRAVRRASPLRDSDVKGAVFHAGQP